MEGSAADRYSDEKGEAAGGEAETLKSTAGQTAPELLQVDEETAPLIPDE